jgi:hypothetical protein
MLLLICGTILALGFIGLGAFLIIRSVQSRKKAEASQGWPSTIGQISESRVVHSTSTDSEGESSDSYTPSVEYTYQVGGQTYTGRDLTFGFTQGYGDEAKAQSALAKYPPGAQVSVSYDPADPQKAVLERQAGGFAAGLILGIIFLVIGLIMSCVGVLVLTYSLVVPVSY